MKENKEIAKAQEEYEYLVGDERERRLAELHEKAIRDENDAYACGEERGKEEGEKIGIEKGEKIGIEKGQKIGRKQGEKIGIEQGRAIMQQEIDKKLLEKGISVKDIIEATGLTKTQIKTL